MTRICNFPISESRRCAQPITDDKPNCGRHRVNLSADQLGQSPTVYKKDSELHVWAGKPDNVYCLIHGDPAYRVLCQLAGEVPPCCLRDDINWEDDGGRWHRDGGPAMIWTDGTQFWYQHGELHRDGGPAEVRPDGTQFWHQHNKLHRDDGPAVMYRNGMQFWYWHGERVTKEEHARRRKRSSGI